MDPKETRRENLLRTVDMSTPSEGKGAMSKTASKRLQLAEEQAKALDYKRLGYSIRQIAVAMNCSPSKAQELVVNGIKTIPDPAREAYANEILEREMAIIAAHWEKRDDPRHAAVIQNSNKAMREMLGLDAPRKQELTGKDGNALFSMREGAEAARLVREAFGDHAAIKHDERKPETAADAQGATGPSGEPGESNGAGDIRQGSSGE